MRYYPKLLRATLTALLLATSIALVNAGPSDDWKAAFDAFKRSDYTTALALFGSLAEQGYAGAQFQLGFMYRNGWGAPKDYAEALKWLRRAAAQGDRHAQSNLGFMYRDGEGVQKDYVQAYMWFNLARNLAKRTLQPSVRRQNISDIRFGNLREYLAHLV
jgi:uncharacterized protein